MRNSIVFSLHTFVLHLRHQFRFFAPLMALLLVGVAPSAFADTAGALTTVTDASDSVLSTINAILRPVSLIAIVVCGLAGAFGKMEWSTVGKVAVGILIANSATTIIDFFGGGGAVA